MDPRWRGIRWEGVAGGGVHQKFKHSYQHNFVFRPELLVQELFLRMHHFNLFSGGGGTTWESAKFPLSQLSGSAPAIPKDQQ